MKKILCILVLLYMSILSVSAQTYCYKALFKVDKDGMREERKGYTYFTFANNMKTCYESDKYGNAKKTKLPAPSYQTVTAKAYKYVGSSNGMWIYKEPDENFGFGHILYGKNYFYFSSDFSRLNEYYPASEYLEEFTIVYEKTEEPSEYEAPKQMY